MDPQNTNNLDPKLQATYDRVMGTNAAPAAGQPAASAAPAPAPAAGQPTAAPAAPTPGIATPAYAADTLSFQAAIQQPTAAAAAPAPAPAPLVVPQQSSGLLKILYIIGGVVFFVVYTIVWIKIFNLPLPF